MLLLLIEDNDPLAFGLCLNLQVEGFRTVRARNAAEGQRLLASDNPDLVLLDLLLPDESGFELLRRIRQGGSRVPVIVLSALNEESDRVLSFRLGANDYVAKPFGLMELIERIKARLHVNGPLDIEILQSGELQLYRSSKRVKVGDTEISLTPKEFLLLQELMRANGSVVSAKELLRLVWHTGEGIETRTVDQHVRQLRRKLEPHGYGSCIRTAPKLGFAFTPKDRT